MLSSGGRGLGPDRRPHAGAWHTLLHYPPDDRGAMSEDYRRTSRAPERGWRDFLAWIEPAGAGYRPRPVAIEGERRSPHRLWPESADAGVRVVEWVGVGQRYGRGCADLQRLCGVEADARARPHDSVSLRSDARAKKTRSWRRALPSSASGSTLFDMHQSLSCGRRRIT